MVTSVREFEDPDATTYSSTDPTTVEFKVDTVWKGPSYETMSLTTARSDASCGFTFIEGEEYVVYSRDGATVSLCSRTRSVAYAQEDFDELGEGDRPGAGSIGPIPEPPRGREADLSDGGTGSCGLSPHAGLYPPRRVGGGPDGRPRLARSAPAASRVGGYAKPSASSMQRAVGPLSISPCEGERSARGRGDWFPLRGGEGLSLAQRHKSLC